MPTVAIIMGSASDWPTLQPAAEALREAGVECETKVVSAHRTPHLLVEYASKAHEQGIRVIIAGAGGAAHLPGMTAAFTHLPVLGVPVRSKAMEGLDSLLSIVQMPFGVPVATFRVGANGARDAAAYALRLLRSPEEDAPKHRRGPFKAA
ncbi:MAG: 5-(carboxyamino)imidazole ribonucleotide mutase [Verrucomicrobia bacterium]|nr:5-(carboxyamino)imidazole ribonucleotide mutase [Verrucomicrobiota bacterium]